MARTASRVGGAPVAWFLANVGSVINLAMLVGTFYLTAALFVAIVLGIVARYNGFSILALIRYIKEELLLVLGTSSSEAALPSLMEKMERAGCRN